MAAKKKKTTKSQAKNGNRAQTPFGAGFDKRVKAINAMPGLSAIEKKKIIDELRRNYTIMGYLPQA